MAKKKKNIQPQQMLSPEQFIKQKARNLPIEVCYISKDIEEVGEGTVIVVRRHPNDKFTLATYLLDIFCLGVKDTFYRLRLDEFEYEEYLDKFTSMDVTEITYNEAHNWIYGAIAFAEEAGIAPHKDFNVTQYMLEEDTEDIPLIEYNYGKDGKHFLVAMSQLELSRYFPILKKNLGDDFDYVLQDDEDEYDDYEEVQDEDEEPIDLEQLMENFKNSPLCKKYGPDTEYTYQHPEYPVVLNIENKGLVSTLFDPANFSGLSDEDTDRILAMPHDTLRRDLEQIILFHTGETCDGIPEDLWEADNGSPITHALFLLGEIGDEGSLDVVLETLRQSSEYSDFHFGDLMTEIYTPTLYKLGKDRLDKLMEFAKEKGLEPLAALIMLQRIEMPLEEAAKEYVSAEKEVASAEEAIAGAKDIIAEHISDEANYRMKIRDITVKEGKISSVAKDKEAESVYEMYYEFEEAISKLAGHRILALNRGEKEDALKLINLIYLSESMVKAL